jgi:hypothetical protein
LTPLSAFSAASNEVLVLLIPGRAFPLFIIINVSFISLTYIVSKAWSYHEFLLTRFDEAAKGKWVREISTQALMRAARETSTATSRLDTTLFCAVCDHLSCTHACVKLPLSLQPHLLGMPSCAPPWSCSLLISQSELRAPPTPWRQAPINTSTTSTHR